MTPLERRIFIYLDEWLGVALLLFLHCKHDPFFWWVLPIWAVAIYGISYPLHWRLQAKEAKEKRDGPSPSR